MNLVKEKWTKKDIAEFNKFLEQNKREDKIDFQKRVCNTNMKNLGIMLPDCKNIAKQIHEGNFKDFLEKNDYKYFESAIVSAFLINYIKDVDEKKKYIDNLYMDTWSTVDTLTFKDKGLEKEYI